ncbi:DNA-binding protein [Afipia sp. P52-10]|uniref:RNA-binding protein n=1 Tax=Afipia sp. P52-10 TaxID=1429916 RepID=UPI0003DF0C61|nr:RNA-binding protein [Afipia sp. P52-10]ETR77984.1 DNA-binding protein [Afipia sp. P52-10]
MLASVDEAHLDDGPKASKPGTVRMCALTRQVRPIDELIRFVVAPSGQVIADLRRKLPGRGLWLTASHRAVAEAAKRGVFSKGFKRDIPAQPALADDTERLMVRAAVEALAIAAKAKQVVSGFAKVENALKRGNAIALIHAADGAADGIRKLDGMIDRETPGFPIITALTSAELDLALGRANVIHAALLAGTAGKTFLSRCEALARFRANALSETANENSGSKAPLGRKTRAGTARQDLGLLDG